MSADDQDSQVREFVTRRCLTTRSVRSRYRRRSPARLYMLVCDFQHVGLAVDPTDGRPLLLVEGDLEELSSVETITAPARLLFIMGLNETQRRRLGKSWAVRVDVLDEMASLGM